MDTIRQTIDDLPKKVTIDIPEHLVHHKAEIIIIPQEQETRSQKRLSDFYGSIPDFPERGFQGEFETREQL